MNYINYCIGTLFVIFLFCKGIYAIDLNLKPRARENFELIELTINDKSKQYRGFSNIINYWHEMPRNYSFGLGLGSIGSPFSETSDSKPSTKFMHSFRLYSVGLEFKKWFKQFPFIRLAAYHNYFQMGAKTPLSGFSNYLGIGWEFDLNGVGVALEAGQKTGFMGGNWRLDSKMMALGIHFYRN